MSSRTTRILTVAGILGPLVWAGAVVYCGAVRPGYDHIGQFVSELAERGSSTEIAMRAIGFCLSGLLIALFGVALLRGTKARAAAVLVIIHAIGRVTAGIFNCDPGCPAASTSLNQLVHNLAAFVNALTIPAAALIWSLHLMKMRRDRRFAFYSAASGILALVFLPLMFINIATRHNVGLYQRLSFGFANLWLAAIAVKMFGATSDRMPADSDEYASLPLEAESGPKGTTAR